LKSKFVSLILSLAVIAGMMLVPATLPGVPAGVALASNDVTVSIDPATTYTLPSNTFTIDAVINNPNGMDVAIAMIELDFDPNYFTVDSCEKIDFPEHMGAAAIDNVNGTISYQPKAALGSSVNLTTIISARINCTAKLLEGSSTVSWVYESGPPPRTTTAEYGATDYLEGGNMSLMNDGTVIIGSPKLTVDVSPAGKGGVSGFGPFPDVSNRSWGEMVALDAQDTTAGWTFDSWSGDIDFAAATNPNQVTMSALSRSVTANFVELPCDLDVDPNTIPQFKARYASTGGNEDSDTVTISNLGGGTLCWQIGTPPSWNVTDTWTYWNTYDSVPNASSGGFDPFPNPYYDPMAACTENNTALTITVTGEDADNYYARADWPMADPQRTSSTHAAICMQDAVVTVDKCTLDYVHQFANLTIVGVGPAYADVSWVYNGCHGWPYYPGKTWSYNMRIQDPITDKNVTGNAMVTAGPGWDPLMTYPDCYTITHFLTDPMVDTFMMQWWSDTARNFVFQWDGGTFNFPPVDVRILQTASIAGLPGPACCDAPSWLSFDQMAGSCGIGESDVLTVTANTSGLASNSYHNGSFCISGCCGSVDYECVNVSLWVQPATVLTDLHRGLPADALLPDAEYPGDSFFVYVNFSSLGDDFNSIGVTDFAPAGWLVETNSSWCVPPASYNKSNYNKAEYAWAGPYNASATFSAKYKVTIPDTATAGSNFWPECSAMPCPPCDGSPINNYPAWVDYWIVADGPFETPICDDREKVVTVPGCVVGETRDVNANLLDTVTVTLYEQPMDWEATDSSSLVPVSTIPAPEHASVEGGTFSEDPTTWYENCADDTGYYWQNASKYCYYSINTSNMHPTRNFSHPDYIDWSTPEKLAAGYRMDFEADYGLVCMAASMSYAMESVNHWLFVPIDEFAVPHPEWQIHSWKADESIHSWQFPCGCNC